LADSASSSGTFARSLLSSLIASAGLATPTWTWVASVGSRRARTRIESPICR
jgi:hypothetical protein